MSLLFGYLTLACFILLAVKYPLRIAGAHKANALLMKLHEAASGGFLLFALIHVFFTFKALAIHGVWLPVMGAAALLTGLVLIYACHMTKDIRKKMCWHRWYSLALLMFIALHMVLYFTEFVYIKYRDKKQRQPWKTAAAVFYRCSFI